MNLFVLRHGHAEAEAPADNLRALSALGEIEVHTVCQHNYDSLKHVQQVFYSPYVRAKETAIIAAQYIDAPSTECDLLVPNGRPDNVIEFLSEVSKAHETVLIVSHQPLVGTLIDELGGFEYGRHRMGTAGLASFKCEPLAKSCCELNWLKHP